MRIAIVVVLLALLPCLVMGRVWNEHTLDGAFNGARCVYAADVDGDGDLDVLGAAYEADDVCWWENMDGVGSSWTKHFVDALYDGAISVYAEDVDGDGDMDVVTAGYTADDITWWENMDGSGLTWTGHWVETNFDAANDVYAADMDGDGDVDVLGAAYVGDEITWWENTDGVGLTWSEHVVRGTFNGAVSVYAEDLDGDGDLDILSGAYYDSNICWWENTDGIGLTWSEHDVAPMYHVSDVYSKDIDSDGDMDILAVAGEGANFISWWENTDGTGLHWTEHLTDPDFTSGRDVHAEDMDNDGDMDILGAAWNDNDITWWENLDGMGLNWTEHTVDGDFNQASCVYAADVNGDGAMDLLGAAAWADDITWWEQIITVEVSLAPISYPVLIPSVGGPFWYSIELTNCTTAIVQGVLTTEAVLPNGYTYGPMMSFNLALASGQTLPSPLLQVDVPGFAPVGGYEFHAIFSPFTAYPPAHSDFFEFEKLSAPSAEPIVGEWSFTSWDEMETVVTSSDELPDEFTVTQAYPNPFNPTTTINVLMPETSTLTVRVYNVAGQQMVELANGQFAAGRHTLIFDGSDLASGMYFVQATIPGATDQIQKVMLIR